MTLLPDSKLTGKPLTLLAAISSAADRRQQLEVAHAYWRVVEEMAEYRFVLDYRNRLNRSPLGPKESGVLRAVQSSAAATLQEAEVAFVAAQHELAAAISLPANDSPPLPADHPHVGKYSTGLDQPFLLGSVPVRAKLIDRTLPIRRQAIESRAMSVRAAEAARAAVVSAYGSGRADLPAVLACLEQELRQRQALMASVCHYNNDIADYALTVAAPGLDTRALVAMLIKPKHDSAVRPAGHFEPIPSTTPWIGGNVPTPAKRPENGDQDVPTPAKRPDNGDQDVPTPAKRPDNGDQDVPTPAKRPVVPVVVPPSQPAVTTANKPVAVDQARRLALTLHQDRTLPGEFGEPLSLEQCLRSRSTGDRRELIEAYWLLRQRAAECVVLAEQVGLLEGLPLQQSDRPGALRLHSARLAAEAALRESRAALIEAQFELANRIGRVSQPAWPMAGTAAHTGRYLLKIEAQPGRLVESWPMRRLAAVVPRLDGSVRQRAVAVTEAEAARAVALAAYLSGNQATEEVLWAIARRSDETLAFLKSVTDYNFAIAEYVLTVLPASTPSDELAAALVATP